MVTFIESLYKSKDSIDFGWNSEPVVDVSSYNVYVGITQSVVLLASGVSARKSQEPKWRYKIPYTANIATVRSVLGLSATSDFTNTVFYFAITYVSGGVESNLADSTIVEVPPVGIGPRFMKDDPTINRHGYVFSDADQRWFKQAGSSNGALMVDMSDYYKSNVTSEYTYDGTNVSAIKSYLSDATTGSPAKLTTYTYSGSQVTKIAITDSTV